MIGQRLHQYVVQEKIGEGGMGVVWKARDTRLDRDVALKVLRSPSGHDSAQLERFVREAKSASALNHPSIVTIYEIDSDVGIDFIAMEYVRGETLAARLRRGPMAVTEAIGCALQVADALACAHAARIVHRDLKPGNIMITSEGLVKVLDFGLAKKVLTEAALANDEADVATIAAITRPGLTVGTLAYMSPEQALGGSVDARSDVFSFGVVIYEMLTAIHPFGRPAQSDTLYHLHFVQPTPLTTLQPGTPPALDAIITKALAKKPEERYREMGEVSAALKGISFAAPAASSIQGPTDVGAVHARVSLPRWAGPLVLVTSLAAIGGLIATGVPWRGQRAVPAAARSSGSELVNPHDLGLQAGALLERHDKDGNVDRAITLLESALRQDQSYAAGYAQLAEAYRQKYRDSPDRQWLQLAADSARKALGLNSDLAMAQIAQAFVALDDGRADDAIDGFRRAAALDPTNARAHMGIAMYHAARRDDTSAEQAFQTAARMNPRDWRTFADWGLFLYRRSRYADAAAVWEKARDVTRDNVVLFKNLGAAYHQLGRYDDAAASLQRALEIKPSAATYTNLGTTRFYQGQYNDAVAAFEKAVELGANSGLYWGNLADAYRWAPGRRAESISAYLRASDIVRTELVAKPAEVDLRSRLALYLAKAGARTEALKEAAEVEKVTSLQPQALIRLAQVHEVSGERAQALNLIERAVQAGFPRREVANEPEFLALRADIRYQRQLANSGR